jgi:hypothetical protein
MIEGHFCNWNREEGAMVHGTDKSHIAHTSDPRHGP